MITNRETNVFDLNGETYSTPMNLNEEVSMLREMLASTSKIATAKEIIGVSDYIGKDRKFLADRLKEILYTKKSIPTQNPTPGPSEPKQYEPQMCMYKDAPKNMSHSDYMEGKIHGEIK